MVPTAILAFVWLEGATSLNRHASTLLFLSHGDRYFLGVGVDVEIVTVDIDYFAFQGDLADVSARLSGFGAEKSPFIQVRIFLVVR